MTGFAGIAMAIQQIRTSIGEIRQRLLGLTRSINEAAAPVAGASDKSSPGETIALLSPANDHVGIVGDGLAGLIDHVTRIQRQAGVVLRGGQPGPIIAALDQVKQVLAAVIRHSGLTQQALNEAIAEARHLGEQGN
jgi:uncharacterized protein DUF6244